MIQYLKSNVQITRTLQYLKSNVQIT